MQYSLIDPILDDIQKVFKDLQVKHDLAHASIERWRWDLPQISLTWKGQDATWRNMNMLLETEGNTQQYPNGQLEINAWQDIRKDNRWFRRRQHQPIAKGAYPTIVASLEQSYEVVAHWTVEDLTNQVPLSEAASALLDQQRGSYTYPSSVKLGDNPSRTEGCRG
jgi:hypothetical protein